ncbi:MAG: serine/threonine-protein phosphatase, partial [Chloroflexi bacterium]|nr:serine/threonine-protein phosphatase [Chloroflexota bacterium]
FTYVRAGHDEPLYVRNDASTEFVGGKGRFLGLWRESTPTFERCQIAMAPGDTMVIYSDGVTDMRNMQGEPFGRDRMASLAKNIRIYDADRIARSIHSVVQSHRGPADAFDDFTLLVMRAE